MLSYLTQPLSVVGQVKNKPQEESSKVQYFHKMWRVMKRENEGQTGVN
jgi:hypothetical protein